ncbi:MAG: AHH domain-containing protein [Sphingomonadaceae bacterium]
MMRQALHSGGNARSPARSRLAFRMVNRKGMQDYDSSLQKHHLIPLQIFGYQGFSRFFADAGIGLHDSDDFRNNGLLLPCSPETAIRMGMPMHRGPHRQYNALVMERISMMEIVWNRHRSAPLERRREQAWMQLRLLQRSLRRKLMNPQGKSMLLSRMDPAGSGHDFTMLDAMADEIWESITGTAEPLGIQS